MMGETKSSEDVVFPGVDSFEGDWFNFGICLDGTNLIKGAQELFRATLKMRNELVIDAPDARDSFD